MINLLGTLHVVHNTTISWYYGLYRNTSSVCIASKLVDLYPLQKLPKLDLPTDAEYVANNGRPICNRAGHYIFVLWFLSRRRLDVYHTSTHGVALVRI